MIDHQTAMQAHHMLVDIVFRNAYGYKGLPIDWELVQEPHTWGVWYEYDYARNVKSYDKPRRQTEDEALKAFVVKGMFTKWKADPHGKPKSRPDLFPADALALAGEVLAFGATKHPSEPWRTMDTATHLAACWRHMLEWQAGRKQDVESGKDHLSHALCRLAMAVAVNAG